MRKNFTIVGIALMILSAAIAGCTSEKDAPAPSPSVSSRAPAPTPTTSAPAPTPPPKPMPGIAYNESGEYTPQSAPSFPAFNVTTSWTMLTIEYYLNATAGCYVIGSEPPAGLGTGPAPAITIKPPVSSAFSFELPPGPGSCGTTNGATIQYDVAEMANEVGPWTISVTGRGQGLILGITVKGE